MKDNFSKTTTIYYYHNTNKVTDFNQWKANSKDKRTQKNMPYLRYKLLGKTLPDQDGDSLWVIHDNIEKRQLRLYFEELIEEKEIMCSLYPKEIADIAYNSGAEHTLKNYRNKH